MSGKEGGLLAVGQIDNLVKGWAIIPFKGEKVHYYVEENTDEMPYIDRYGRVRFYTSLCGLEAQTDSQRPAIVLGNFPKCKRCLKML